MSCQRFQQRGQRNQYTYRRKTDFLSEKIWEPTITEILESNSSSTTLPVDEIWSLDAVNQGDAGLINEAVLGESCNLMFNCLASRLNAR